MCILYANNDTASGTTAFTITIYRVELSVKRVRKNSAYVCVCQLSQVRVPRTRVVQAGVWPPQHLHTFVSVQEGLVSASLPAKTEYRSSHSSSLRLCLCLSLCLSRSLSATSSTLLSCLYSICSIIII